MEILLSGVPEQQRVFEGGSFLCHSHSGDYPICGESGAALLRHDRGSLACRKYRAPNLELFLGLFIRPRARLSN